MRRARPELAGRPLVVGGTPAEPRRPVLDCCPAARASGVRLGMAVREAQARCPEAAFLPPDEAAAAAMQEHLLDLLARLSPDVEGLRPGLALFAAGGAGRCEPDEAAPARALLAALEAELGAAGRVGIAGGRFCARVAAAYAAPLLVVPPGGERQFLAPLPVAHLPGLEPWHWRLQFLGIRTIGDYAGRLPYADVAVRYGPEAALAHRLARGLDPAPLQPCRPDEPRLAVQRFDPPEARLEPLVFALKRQLDRLCADLADAGRVCAALELRCRCEGAAEAVVAARPAEPTASATRLRDLLRWALERRQGEAARAGRPLFGGGVAEFELRLAELAPARGRPLSLFGGDRAGRQQAVGAAIERLEALLGPEAVRQATLADGRRPEEGFGWAPFRPPLDAPGPPVRRRPAPGKHQAAAGRVRPLPLRPVADGRPAALDGPGAGPHAPAMRLFDPPRPAPVRWREGAISAVAAGRGLEAVLEWSGPWRLEERWWAGSAGRDYYQAATRLGRVYLLFQEGEAWFVQGAFD